MAPLKSVEFDDESTQPAPSERLRRILEGVIGVPATEGNRIDVSRNGVEIFPAMLQAIDDAEHTVDFLTFVYWTGEIGRIARENYPR